MLGLHLQSAATTALMTIFREAEPMARITKLSMLGSRTGGIDWEFGMDMYTVLSLKQTTYKGLLYSPGNSAQHFVIN